MNPSQDMPFWRTWQVGERVVVRYRIEDETYSYSDALGDLARVDHTGVEVITRRGPVSIPAARIEIGKKVPPPPKRRRPRRPADGD